MRALLAIAVLLAGCGPVPVAQAERDCLERARLAQQPRGTIGVGASNSGPAARLDVTISSDFILGRDPSAVFDACVMQRSGDMPSRPLYLQPGWRG